MRVGKFWVGGVLCLALPLLAWADDEQPQSTASSAVIELADASDAQVDEGIAEAANDDKPADGQEEQMQAGSEEDAEMAQLDAADEQLERRTDEIVDAYRAAHDDNEKAQLRETLAAVVNEHFDVRQKRREREIARLEDELSRLKKVVERRTAAREKIVSRRIDELAGDDGDDLSF